MLVARAFIPNPNNFPIVNHKDGEPKELDNSADNLEWSTYARNNKHAYDTGLKESVKGEKSHFNKFPESLIRKICEDFEKGYTPIDLFDKYPVSLVHLRSILYEKKWSHITKDYDFKKRFRYNKTYSTENKMKIAELIKQGFVDIEILEIIGLDITNGTHKQFISNMRNIIHRIEGSTTSPKLIIKVNL